MSQGQEEEDSKLILQHPKNVFAVTLLCLEFIEQTQPRGLILSF